MLPSTELLPTGYAYKSHRYQIHQNSWYEPLPLTEEIDNTHKLFINTSQQILLQNMQYNK